MRSRLGCKELKYAAHCSTPVWEEDERTQRIRCRECIEANPMKASWLIRGSAKRHLDGGEHINNVQANKLRREAAMAQQKHMEAPYASSSYALLNSVHPTTSTRANYQEFDGTTMPDLTPCNDDSNDMCSATFNQLSIPSGVAPFEDNSAEEHERLKLEVQRLLMQAEQDDLIGYCDNDDDATVTNITNEFESLGMIYLPLYS